MRINKDKYGIVCQLRNYNIIFFILHATFNLFTNYCGTVRGFLQGSYTSG